MSEEEKVKAFGEELQKAYMNSIYHAPVDLDEIDKQNAEAIKAEIEEYLKRKGEQRGNSPAEG